MTSITESQVVVPEAGPLGYIASMPLPDTDAGPGLSTSGAARILVVDDQETIQMAVSAALERDGYACEVCGDGATALERIASDPPALVILDVGMSGMDGLAVLRELRRSSDLPVIMLTARDEEFDRVLGLELGADDYVAKPFSSRELLARVRSVLRRSTDVVTAPVTSAEDATTTEQGEQQIVYGSLRVDLLSREVWLDGSPVELTRREFDLLAMLIGSPRRVFSREQLLAGVWDSSTDWQAPSTVTEHVRRLRQKLEADPRHPKLIQTSRGVGYRFVPPSS